MNPSFENAVALVTGAASGIGFATARTFAEAGAAVALADLVARDRTAELPRYVELALDSGVTPGEASELVTHLAFYAGWPNAFSALSIVGGVLAGRPHERDLLNRTPAPEKGPR